MQVSILNMLHSSIHMICIYKCVEHGIETEQEHPKKINFMKITDFSNYNNCRSEEGRKFREELLEKIILSSIFYALTMLFFTYSSSFHLNLSFSNYKGGNRDDWWVAIVLTLLCSRISEPYRSCVNNSFFYRIIMLYQYSRYSFKIAFPLSLPILYEKTNIKDCFVALGLFLLIVVGLLFMF